MQQGDIESATHASGRGRGVVAILGGTAPSPTPRKWAVGPRDPEGPSNLRQQTLDTLQHRVNPDRLRQLILEREDPPDCRADRVASWRPTALKVVRSVAIDQVHLDARRTARISCQPIDWPVATPCAQVSRLERDWIPGRFRRKGRSCARIAGKGPFRDDAAVVCRSVNLLSPRPLDADGLHTKRFRVTLDRLGRA
jgi:hypothetical protein